MTGWVTVVGGCVVGGCVGHGLVTQTWINPFQINFRNPFGYSHELIRILIDFTSIFGSTFDFKLNEFNSISTILLPSFSILLLSEGWRWSEELPGWIEDAPGRNRRIHLRQFRYPCGIRRCARLRLSRTSPSTGIIVSSKDKKKTGISGIEIIWATFPSPGPPPPPRRVPWADARIISTKPEVRLSQFSLLPFKLERFLIQLDYRGGGWGWGEEEERKKRILAKILWDSRDVSWVSEKEGYSFWSKWK